MSDGLILGLFAAFLLAVLLFLRWRDRSDQPRRKLRRQGKSKPRKTPRRPSPPRGNRPQAVVDGSNVMHWDENKPQLKPVKAALDVLDRRGYHAGVIFDANAGYKLFDRYLDDGDFARMLKLPKDRVLVVPKGTQADPFLLTFANDANAIVISNDRFRDRIGEYPKLGKEGRLIQGGWADGQIWLDFPRR